MAVREGGEDVSDSLKALAEELRARDGDSNCYGVADCPCQFDLPEFAARLDALRERLLNNARWSLEDRGPGEGLSNVDHLPMLKAVVGDLRAVAGEDAEPSDS